MPKTWRSSSQIKRLGWQDKLKFPVHSFITQANHWLENGAQSSITPTKRFENATIPLCQCRQQAMHRHKSPKEGNAPLGRQASQLFNHPTYHERWRSHQFSWINYQTLASLPAHHFSKWILLCPNDLNYAQIYKPQVGLLDVTLRFFSGLQPLTSLGK